MWKYIFTKIISVCFFDSIWRLDFPSSIGNQLMYYQPILYNMATYSWAS